MIYLSLPAILGNVVQYSISFFFWEMIDLIDLRRYCSQYILHLLPGSSSNHVRCIYWLSLSNIDCGFISSAIFLKIITAQYFSKIALARTTERHCHFTTSLGGLFVCFVFSVFIIFFSVSFGFYPSSAFSLRNSPIISSKINVVIMIVSVLKMIILLHWFSYPNIVLIHVTCIHFLIRPNKDEW